MLITRELLDELTARAKASDRLRMHFDMRDSAEDGSMRMLNAIEPGTVIPVHRHRETSEDVIVLRGEAVEVLYDSAGREVERWHLVAGSECVACHVPKGQFHTCKSLRSGTVIVEFKNGRYDPVGTEELLER
jgi:hypothetical protein